MLRTYHESALDAPKRSNLMETKRKVSIFTKTKEKRGNLFQKIEKTAADFIQMIIFALGNSTYVTSSEEDISLWVDTLENCAQNSTHLPLLQQAVELWFKSNSRNIQEVIPIISIKIIIQIIGSFRRNLQWK